MLDENFEINYRGQNFMFFNENDSSGYDYNTTNVYDSFREVTEMIYSDIEKIQIQKSEPSLDLIWNLKNSFNEGVNILSHLDFLKEQYYDFSSIKDMAFYILEEKSLLPYLSIIKDLVNSFYNTIQLKKEFCDVEYDEFSDYLIDAEQFFFTELYTPSENYDEELLCEISNLLLG